MVSEYLDLIYGLFVSLIIIMTVPTVVRKFTNTNNVMKYWNISEGKTNIISPEEVETIIRESKLNNLLPFLLDQILKKCHFIRYLASAVN